MNLSEVTLQKPQRSWTPNRDLNLINLQCESGMLTIRPDFSVTFLQATFFYIASGKLSFPHASEGFLFVLLGHEDGDDLVFRNVGSQTQNSTAL
jgi:hypothetical protein